MPVSPRFPSLPALLLVVGVSLAACAPWLASAPTRSLPRLSFKNLAVFIRSEWTGTAVDAANVEDFEATLRTYGAIGFFTRAVQPASTNPAEPPPAIPASRIFTFVEPVLTVGTTSAKEIPEAMLTTEPGAGGTFSKVTKQPLFQLRYMKVRWEVPGFTAPPEQTVDVQIDMRTTSQVLPRIPMTHPTEVIRKVQEAGAANLGHRGTLTVDLHVRDLDPLVADGDREFIVTRTIPLLFTSGSVLMAEAISGGSPLPLGGAVTGLSGAAPPSPSAAAPTAAPSADASASPAPSPAATPR